MLLCLIDFIGKAMMACEFTNNGTEIRIYILGWYDNTICSYFAGFG